MKKQKQRLALLCAVVSLFALSMAAFWLFGSNVKTAYAAAEHKTEIPNERLESLSYDGGVYAYANKTGTATVRYTPSGTDSDYSLANATDIAFRFGVSYRQINKPNSGTGLCYVRIKFKNNDKLYGITKEDVKLTFVESDGSVGLVRISNGGKGVGGQINCVKGTDGTLVVPLSCLMDGSTTTDLGASIVDTENYAALEIEYVDFVVSAYRYDFVFGQFAIVRKTGETYNYDVLPFVASESGSSLLTLVNNFYDTVDSFKVNGNEAVKNSDGLYEAALDGIGTVSFDCGDSLRFFDKVKVSLDGEEGYGITGVKTFISGFESGENNQTSTPLASGHAYGFDFAFRPGERDENTSVVGLEPLHVRAEVTVSELVKVDCDNAGAIISIIGVDDNSDGKLYMKADEDYELKVVPVAGFEFAGISLNGETVSDRTENDDGSYLYTIRVGENARIGILGLGETTGLMLSVPEVGGKASIDNEEVHSGNYATNLYKKHELTIASDKGYAASVKLVYAAAEGEEAKEIALAEENGKYVFIVDGAFTVKVEFTVREFVVTYRLNGGALAGDKTNPEKITYFDTIALNAPVKEGYAFTGWRIEGTDGLITELKNVESDIVVIAVFEMEEDPVDSGDSGSKTDSSGCEKGCFGALDFGGAFVLAVLAAAVFAVRKKNYNR